MNGMPSKFDYDQVIRNVRDAGLSNAQIRNAFVRLASRGDVEVDGTDVALASLAYSERSISELLMFMLHAPNVSKISLRSDLLEGLHEQQEAAVLQACSSTVSVLTGGPGTGKTHVVRRILAAFQATGMEVALAAPTGKAAIRMQEMCGHPASTIHRLLKFHPEVGFRYSTRRPVERTDEGQWILGGPIPVDAIIVDEVSMVDVELMDALLAGAANGTRIVLVGDVDQLPSVGAGRVLFDIIESGVVPVTRLTHIFRQASDSPIPHLAHAVNQGADLSEYLTTSGMVQMREEQDVDGVVRAVTTLVAHTLPASGVAPKDIQVLCPQKGAACGVEALNVALKAALNDGDGVTPINIGGGYACHVGDRVIQTANSYTLADEERGFVGTFNGEIGTVVAGAAGGLLNVDDDVIVSEGEKTQPVVLVVDYGDRKVGYKAAEVRDLQLAYAVTGHKYQGSQSRCVVVPVHSVHQWTLTRPWLYTAITRASERLVLVGQPEAVAAAASNTRGTCRGTRLQVNLQMAASDA